MLDGWSSHDWSAGLRLDQLAALDRLTVRTANSTYDIVITDPETAAVLVRGGRFFPEFAHAHVAGSSLGGSFLKLHTIQPGFRIELVCDGRAIVTSAVQNVCLAASRAANSRVM